MARKSSKCPVTLALTGLEGKDLVKVVKQNQIGDSVKTVMEKGANSGIIRMSIGNALRRKVKKGQSVTINGNVITSLEVEEVDEEEVEEAA